MMLIDHGYFTLYKPLDPHLVFGLDPRVLYCCNEKGEDWYYIVEKEKQESRERGPHFYSLVRSDHIVAAVETVADRLWPNEFRLIETDYPIERGMRFTGSGFEPGQPLPRTPAQEHIARRNPSNAPKVSELQELPVVLPAEPTYHEPVIEEELLPPRDYSWPSILERASNTDAGYAGEPIPEANVRMPEAFRSGPLELPAEEPEPTDDERRASGRAAVLAAVREATDYPHQVRWELALMANNRNTNAMASFEQEAKFRGTTVQAVVEQIIQQRHAHERRVAFVHTIQAEYLKAVDGTSGSEIEIMTDAALHRIKLGE